MSEATDRAARYWVASRDADDPWVHSMNGTDWYSHYEQLTSTPFHGHGTEAWLGPIQVLYEDVNSSFRYQGRPWKGSQIFFAAYPGTGDLYYDNRPLPADSFVTHRWDSFDRMSCNGAYKAVFIAIDEEFFQRHTEQVAGRRFCEDRRNAFTFSSDPAVAAHFQRRVLQVLKDLTAAPDVLSNEHARRAFQDTVLGTVIEALESSQDSAARLPPPMTRAYVADKAMQFMEARLAEPIALADICAAVRVSARTLRYSFEEILGVSPTRYLLARRLNQVRRELAASAHPATIEEIAFRWGFWHMGRFAQFYRQSFGERPSDTRRRHALRQ